jgi:tetratricopeptide (TPR) repeat protein
VASCVLASPAVAEPREARERDSKAVSDKDKQVASDLVKKAIARSQAGDHSAAIDIYLQAYTIVPNSILLSNIGSEFQQQGKKKEALRYFCMYLEKDPEGTNVPYATTQARQLQIMLGNKPDEDDVCAQPKRRPEPSPDDEGDDPVKHGPKAAPAAPTAEQPAEGNSTMRYTGLALGAAGVVGLALGIYGGIEAKKISDEISGHDPKQGWDGYDAQEKRGQRYEYLQIGGLVGGGVLVGVGIYLYLHSSSASEQADKPAKSDKAKDERVVRVTPTTNGVAVFGRF